MKATVLSRVVLIVGGLVAAARAGHSSCETALSVFDVRGATPVVYGVVDAHRPPEEGSRSLDFRVLRVLQGHEARPAVRLWQLGPSSAFVDRFPIGRKMVVALKGEGGWNGLPEGTHVLQHECGTNFVRVRESKDESGLYLSEIERRLAAAR